MKFFARLFTCLLFTFPMSHSFAQGEEQIKDTLIAMWEAIEEGDIDKYETYIHPDFTSFGENNVYRMDGKDLEIESIGSWISRSESIHTEMHQPKVTIMGNVAWITYYWTDSGITDGERFATRGKSTRIFVKEGERWLCIHGHYTSVP